MLLRRLEVARLAAQGLSLRQVARVVRVSHETVRKDLDWGARELARVEMEQERRKSAWRAWCAWCDARGYQPLPADPVAVAAYLSAWFLQGSPASMVRWIREVIGDAHRDEDLTNPTTHESVRRVFRGELEFAALMAEAAKSVADEGWKSGPPLTGADMARIAKASLTVIAEFEADSGRAGDASNCRRKSSTSCSEVEQGVEEHAVEQDDTWETWDL